MALGFFIASDLGEFNDFIEGMRPVCFRRENCSAGADEREQDIVRADVVHKVLPELVRRADGKA